MTESVRPPSRLPVLVWVIIAVLIPTIVTVELGRSAYVLRDYPGAVVGPVTAFLRGLAEGAGLIVAGAVTSAMFLQRLRANRAMHLTESFEIVVLRSVASWWFLLAFALVVFEGVDSVGVSPRVLADVGNLLDLVAPISYARAWMVVAVCAAGIYVATWFVTQWWHLLIPLALSMLGNLAPVVVGSILVGPNHDFGGDAGIVLACVTAGYGGATLMLALRRSRGRDVSQLALQRWVRVGVVAMPVMVACEVIVVWFKLAGSSPLASLAGAFSLVRLLSMAVLWSMVITTRSALEKDEVDGIVRGRWLQPAALAVVVGAACQVAMTRFLSPQFLVETSISQVYLGFDLPDAPSFITLLTHWRPNLLFMFAASVAAVLYALGLRRLRHRGGSWSLRRTVPWFAGCALLVVSTSSGVGKYSGADFAVHMAMHMALNMLTPILLVLGGPITLALLCLSPSKPPGPREWIAGLIDAPLARRMYHPIWVLATFIGSYYVLYLTPLFEFMSRDHWAHQLMNVHFVVVGLMYYGLIIGVDRTPYQLPHVARLGYVFAAMPFHAFFGVIVMSSNQVIADDFYTHLEPTWAGDLLATQYIGGGIAWAGGEIPLLIVIIALIAQWRANDAREGHRKDRHLDSGLDDEFETYNRMLGKLAERDNRAPRRAATHDGDRT